MLVHMSRGVFRSTARLRKAIPVKWAPLYYVLYICTVYVDQKGSAPILDVKRSAGDAPEVYLRNLLHAGNDASKRGKTQPEVPQKHVISTF